MRVYSGGRSGRCTELNYVFIGVWPSLDICLRFIVSCARSAVGTRSAFVCRRGYSRHTVIFPRTLSSLWNCCCFDRVETRTNYASADSDTNVAVNDTFLAPTRSHFAVIYCFLISWIHCAMNASKLDCDDVSWVRTGHGIVGSAAGVGWRAWGGARRW